MKFSMPSLAKRLRLPTADIPFNREDATRAMPWVIAVMVAVVGMMMVIGISLQQASDRSSRLNIRSFQIYVPHGVSTPALMERVGSVLKGHASVASHRQIKAEELQRLIRPWTGVDLPLAQLPLPVVIEVLLKDKATRSVAVADIQQVMKALDKRVEVESYQDWVDRLMQFAQILRATSFALMTLLVIALLVLVMVVVRTSLKLHFSTVRILHNFGATDDYITRQFVVNACVMVLRGAVMGVGIAALMAVVLGRVSVQLASPLLPVIELGWAHALGLLLMPLLLAAFAFLIVRHTIQTMLEQMP